MKKHDNYSNLPFKNIVSTLIQVPEGVSNLPNGQTKILYLSAHMIDLVGAMCQDIAAALLKVEALVFHAAVQ